jgi:2C-methyl-D-erythritol 2,4-cyclodiphosphate synthase
MEESDRQRGMNERRMDALRTIVNDDNVEISLEERELINNPEMKMMENGEIVKRADIIPRSRQFSRANLVGGINLEKPKRTRKKTKTDKNMSKALRLANERFRKNNGQLRKGATQSKIMKYAHKLLGKM